MVTRDDYDDAKVAAVRAELGSAFRALGEYREHMVLVGGWVPEMLMPDSEERHAGSLDVDIALDHKAINDSFYARITEILGRLGYVRDAKIQHRFTKPISVQGSSFDVHLDLLAGEYGGRSKSHRHQHVQDVEAHKARGCDLAFDSAVELELEMTLVGGAVAKVRLRIAGIAAFIVMKAFAMKGRDNPKDAYDIAYCLRNYPGGVEAVAEEVRKFGTHGLVREAMGYLSEDFKSIDQVGPTGVAIFQGLLRGEDRELARRDALERVQELIRLVGANGID